MVESVCSFTWAQDPHDIEYFEYIWSEYGERFSREEFKKMLRDSCPIRFYHLIGMEFS
jgi:hypothetical protein